MIGSKRISFFFFRQEKGGDEGEGHGSLVQKKDLFSIEKVLQNFFAFSFHFSNLKTTDPL